MRPWRWSSKNVAVCPRGPVVLLMDGSGNRPPARRTTLTRRRLIISTIITAALALALAGCSAKRIPPSDQSAPPVSDKVKKATQKPYTIDGKTYYPVAAADGYSEKGLASWYGRPFHGRKAASGETYDMFALTAAHRVLPMGTRVEVKNLQNGQTVYVRINDRGPFVAGRVIDLSYAAAKKIGMVGPGTAMVRLTAVGQTAAGGKKAVEPLKIGPLTVQIGAFTNQANARRLAQELDKRYGEGQSRVITVDQGGTTYHRVQVFTCPDQTCAEDRLLLLKHDGYGVGFIVAKD